MRTWSGVIGARVWPTMTLDVLAQPVSAGSRRSRDRMRMAGFSWLRMPEACTHRREWSSKGPLARSRLAHAAVDADHLAIDVTGRIGTQERHQVRNFLRTASAAGGHHLADRFGREQLRRHPPRDHAGR